MTLRRLCAWLLPLALLLPATASAATARELAAKHQPVLMLDGRERWRPLEIEAFLGESHRACTRRNCDRVVSTPADLFGLPILDVTGNERDGRGYATPSRRRQCARSKPIVNCDSGARSVMYYEVRRPESAVVIDYWWFFRYNDYPHDNELKCRHRSVCHDHEGDWEGVRVVLRGGSVEVRFDAHGRSERYTRLKPLRRRGRPVVFVAHGTHAAYPRACRRDFCKQTGAALPEGRHNGKRPWGLDDCPQDSCLRALPSDGWTTWPGLWGRGCATLACVRQEGPRSPGLQRRQRVTPSARTSFRRIKRAHAYELVIRYIFGG